MDKGEEYDGFVLFPERQDGQERRVMLLEDRNSRPWNFDQENRRYWRERNDGSIEWVAPSATASTAIQHNDDEDDEDDECDEYDEDDEDNEDENREDEESISALGSALQQSSLRNQWTWSDQYQRHYRETADGSIEWAQSSRHSETQMLQPQTQTEAQISAARWTWSDQHRRCYRQKADGTIEWSQS